ncbi:MAG TPA: ABC-2 family transporter protein [Candidatus Limnocylindria bacterium]|nr:ABC-2 family transporter protein [Candidatus Limnocylindria bacterium]
MAEILDGAALYLRLVRARLRAQLQYRSSFVLDVIGTFVISFLDFVVILIIFTNVPQLGSWSVAEVALLYGISCLAFALTDLVIGHLDLFPQTIRDGTFDLVLVRPRPTLFMVLTADFQIRRLGRISQAAVVLVYALANVSIDWTSERALVLAGALVTGVLIFIAIWVTVICIAFWTVEGREVANAFTYGGVTLAQYPIDIYDRWMRSFFAYVVPVAFVAYYPALFILGKRDPLGLPTWASFISPFVALGAALVALSVWRWAVRHYRSAGG